jgi:hypothetical protein
MDPLRDYATQLVWRMKKLGVDIQAYLFKHWCHGVLSFDLKIGGIEDSHKSNELNVQWFKEIFDKRKKIISKVAPGTTLISGIKLKL